MTIEERLQHTAAQMGLSSEHILQSGSWGFVYRDRYGVEGLVPFYSEERIKPNRYIPYLRAPHVPLEIRDWWLRTVNLAMAERVYGSPSSPGARLRPRS